MKNHDFRGSLDRVRGELERVEFRQPEDRPRIEALLAEIESHVAGAQTSAPTQTLLDRIQSAVRGFEVEHPNLTGYLGQLFADLSTMGL